MSHLHNIYIDLESLQGAYGTLAKDGRTKKGGRWPPLVFLCMY